LEEQRPYQPREVSKEILLKGLEAGIKAQSYRKERQTSSSTTIRRAQI
jgi:hypothetical protein